MKFNTCRFLQEDLIWRHKGNMHLSSIIDSLVDAVYKLQLLDREWMFILQEIICNILKDYSQLDEYMKKLYKTLETER